MATASRARAEHFAQKARREAEALARDISLYLGVTEPPQPTALPYRNQARDLTRPAKYGAGRDSR